MDHLFSAEDEAAVRSVLDMMAGGDPEAFGGMRDLFLSSLEHGRELVALADDEARFAARLHAIKGTAGLGGLTTFAAEIEAAEAALAGLSAGQRREIGAKFVGELEWLFRRLQALTP